MEIVYIVTIKDGIMLPSVFNDFFEEAEGRKALTPFLLLIFTNQFFSQCIFSSVSFR